MSRRRFSALALTLCALVLAAACADDSDPGGAADSARSETSFDLGLPDQLSADGALAFDADGHPRDLAPDGLPLPGLGSLSGACGILDADEWGSPSPFLFRNALDLGTATFEPAALSPGGQQIWSEGNLNDGSLASEVFAFEVQHRCELATLLKTEGMVTYDDPAGKKTDLLVAIDGQQIGISVTRAYHYPPGEPFTVGEAAELLAKKLADLPLSQENGSPPDRWIRSILQVMAYDSQHADALEQAWELAIDAALKRDAILMITVTDGQDTFIY